MHMKSSIVEKQPPRKGKVSVESKSTHMPSKEGKGKMLKQRERCDPTDLDMTHIVPKRLYERMRHLMVLPPFDDREFEDILAVRLKDAGGPGAGPHSDGTDADDDDDDDDEDNGDATVHGGEGGDRDRRGGSSLRQPSFELTVDARMVSRQRKAAAPSGGDATVPTGDTNWMEGFLRRTSNERIRWQTKYYRTDQKLLDKPLFQQIEELIDLGAQDFSEWLNGLGAEKSNITKDIIKQLFSIEIEDEMARAIRVETKEVRAIPAQAAREWNLEHMSLQRRIEQVMRADRRAARKSRERNVAFGRTLPNELRTVNHRDAIDSILPDFPDDMRTLKALFRDIRHLRSVRYLIEHLHDRVDIQRPRYLVDTGMFRGRTVTGDTPFYQRVLSRKDILDSVRN